MKKSVSLLLAGAMCAGLLAGCSSSSTSGGASAAASGSTAPSSVVSGEAGSKSIEKLSIAFVPSREPEEIITATEPLKEMLTAELAGLGYDVGEVVGIVLNIILPGKADFDAWDGGLAAEAEADDVPLPLEAEVTNLPIRE